MRTQRKEYSAEEIYKLANKSIAYLESDFGHGSGVVVSSDGLILTNYHCYSDKNLSITIGSKKYKTINVVNAYVNVDLILLKIKAKGLKPLTLAKTNKINIGSKVFAIGTPSNIIFRNTIHDGIISGMRIMDNCFYIQTNAFIHSGQSGGALLNNNCELIGVTSRSSPKDQGLNFAIHKDLIKILLEDKFSKINKILLPYNKYLYNGELQIKREDYKEAKKSLNIYLKHNTKDFYAYFLRGSLFEKVGYLSEAISDYKKSIKYDDKEEPFISDKAYLALYRLERKPKRKQYFLNCASIINPYNSEIILYIGDEYLNKKDYVNAEKAYNKAINIIRHPSDAYQKLAELYYAKGFYQKAINYLKKAAYSADKDAHFAKEEAEKDFYYKNAATYYYNAAFLLYKNNYKIKKEIYSDILDNIYLSLNINQRDSQCCFLLCKCYVDLFNYQKAYEAILNTFFYDTKKIINNWPEYQYYYGVIAKNLMGINPSLPYFKKALKLIDEELPLEKTAFKGKKNERNDNMELKAEIYCEMGEYKIALSEFKKVLKNSPNTNLNRLKYLRLKIQTIDNILKTPVN